MHADYGEGREFCQRRNMEYNRRSSQQGEPHQLDSIWQILINIKAKTTSSKTIKDQQSRVKQETGTGRVPHNYVSHQMNLIVGILCNVVGNSLY